MISLSLYNLKDAYKCRGFNCLEIPGLVLAAVIVDRLGRKVSMSALLFLCFLFMLPLVVHQSAGLTTAVLFGARACIMGSFTLMF